MLTNLVAWSRAKKVHSRKKICSTWIALEGARKVWSCPLDGHIAPDDFPSLIRVSHCDGFATELSQKALEALGAQQLQVLKDTRGRKKKIGCWSRWKQLPECDGTSDCWQEPQKQDPQNSGGGKNEKRIKKGDKSKTHKSEMNSENR